MCTCVPPAPCRSVPFCSFPCPHSSPFWLHRGGAARWTYGSACRLRVAAPVAPHPPQEERPAGFWPPFPPPSTAPSPPLPHHPVCPFAVQTFAPLPCAWVICAGDSVALAAPGPGRALEPRTRRGWRSPPGPCPVPGGRPGGNCRTAARAPGGVGAAECVCCKWSSDPGRCRQSLPQVCCDPLFRPTGFPHYFCFSNQSVPSGRETRQCPTGKCPMRPRDAHLPTR
jgi:hypothetical protein